MTISSLIVDVYANTAQLRKDVSEIHGQFDKLGDLATELAGTLGVAFTVDKAVQFVRAVVTLADQIQRLSDRTGIGTEALQRLGAVAVESGNSMDDIARAVSQMQKRIAGGDASAVSAIETLHLKLYDLQQLDPESQFTEIAKSIALIPDPAKRTALAMEIFGKAGAEILPTILADIERIAKGTTVMSDLTIKTLDSAGDAWERFANRTKVAVGNVTAVALETLEYLYRATANFGRGNALGFMPDQGATPFATDAPTHGVMPIGIGMPNAAAAQTAFDAGGGNIAIEKHIKDLRDAKKAAEEAAEAQKKFLASVKDVRDLQGTVLSLNRLPMVPGIESFDLAGAEQLPLDARQYGGYAGQNFNLSPYAPGGGGMPTSPGFFGSLMGGLKGIAGGITPGNIGTGIAQSLGGMITGGISSLISAGIGGIGKLFGKLFDDPEKTINPIRDAFVHAAGGLDVLNMKAHDAGVTLTALLDAKNPEQYQRALESLTNALDFQENAMATLDATVAKYGFTIEQLGPALQRQNLEKQAETLIQDWKVLTSAGIDVGVVTDKMADSINAYFKSALATGMEVPLAMKPLLDQMVSLGLLTDQAGNVITDLGTSGVTFSETMSQGFQKVVDSVNKLAEAISRGLGVSLDSAAASADRVSKAVTSIPNIPYGGDGGWGLPAIPMAAGGLGRVYKPTLFLAGEAGPEDVAFSGGGRSLGGDQTEVKGLRNDLRRLPDMLAIALKAAWAQAS